MPLRKQKRTGFPAHTRVTRRQKRRVCYVSLLAAFAGICRTAICRRRVLALPEDLLAFRRARFGRFGPGARGLS